MSGVQLSKYSILEEMAMEYIKEKIINILKEDARIAPSEIAGMLTVSEKEICDIIQELEDDKVILRYTTVVNREKISDSVVALIEVKATPQKGSGFAAIAKKIYQYEQVKSCYLISGDYDFMVIIHEANMRKVADFVHEKLAVIDGVNSTATHFVLKEYKDYGVIFEDDIQDERLVVTP